MWKICNNICPVTNDAVGMDSRKKYALAALFLGAAAIGFAPIFVRLAIRDGHVGPVGVAFWRLALSIPALVLWTALDKTGSHRKPTTGRDYARLLGCGVFFAADLSVWHWSVKETSVANATLLANFAPVFVTIGAWLFLKIKPHSTFVIGMVVALAGAGVLSSTSLTISPEHVVGDSLGLLTAVFYGGYILIVKELRNDFSVSTIMAWSAISCTLLLLPISLLSEKSIMPLTTNEWIVVVGLALISHVGGQSLIAYGLAYLPASFSSVTLLLQPLVAALAAGFILGEGVYLLQAIGGGIILGGILIAKSGS